MNEVAIEMKKVESKQYPMDQCFNEQSRQLSVWVHFLQFADAVTSRFRNNAEMAQIFLLDLEDVIGKSSGLLPRMGIFTSITFVSYSLYFLHVLDLIQNR